MFRLKKRKNNRVFRMLPTHSDTMYPRFLSSMKDFFHVLSLINMQNSYRKKMSSLKITFP